MKKISDIYNKYKGEVMVGIITSFFWVIISSIFKYLKNGGKILKSFLADFLCYQMGRLSDYTLIESICCIFLYIFIGMLLSLTIIHLFKGKVKKIVSDKTKKYNRILLMISSTLLVIMLLTYSYTLMYCVNLKHNFDLEMTALKPYISQNEYDKMYSKWVTMMKRKDYKEIKKRILKLKCKYMIDNEEIKKVICK